MSNRHFKLNTVKLNSYSLVHHTCSSYKLFPRPQTLLSRSTSFSHISPTQLVNPTGSIIQAYPPPLTTSIRHLSARLVYHYDLVSKHSQNIPFKIYITSHLCSESSNAFPTTCPSFCFIHARYAWAFGLSAVSACHDLPLDIIYMSPYLLQVFATCHLLSEDFIWPLYLDLLLSPTLP